MANLLAKVFLTALPLLHATANCQDASAPEQIHLSFGPTTDEFVVMWSAQERPSNSSAAPVVLFGTDVTKLDQSAQSQVWHFTEGNPDGVQWVFRTRLQNLAPGSTYHYQVSVDSRVYSDVFNFTVPKPEGYPLQLVMFGDMGKTKGSPTLPHLTREAHSGENVALIHVGDFAYNLDTLGGKRGDEFMRRLQDIAAYIPYMTCAGNHEIPYRFSHYRNRFTMPTAMETPLGDELWWSMDIGPVHLISYDTEIYFTRPDLLQPQLDFLEHDLSLANRPEQRQAVPWVVAFGHRPMYCSNIDGDDCTTPKSVVRAKLESVFYRHGVDFIIQGHEHSYERLYPVFNETVTQKDYVNPRAPVHVISGQAGCNEDLGLCADLYLGAKGEWSAFRASIPGVYGYGKLRVLNATHAEWSQIYDVTSQAVDTITVVQERHGPFDRRAPGDVS